MNPLPSLRELERMTPDDLGVLMHNHLDSLEQIQTLVDLGANIMIIRPSSPLTIHEEDDYTALHSVSRRGYTEICAFLLDQGARWACREERHVEE